MMRFDETMQAWIQDPEEVEAARKIYEQQCNELYDLIKEYCEWYNDGKTNNNMSPNSIHNALLRAGIRTIDELKSADEAHIASIRNVGKGKKFALIMTMKLSLEQTEEG